MTVRHLFQTRRPKVAAALIAIIFALAIPAAAQQTFKKDTTIILLSDLHIQLECQQALNDLYNFKFPQAEYQFRYLRAQYGWHPLPYFLMGLIEWWKIMPNTNDTSHDDVFLAYMDSTIRVGERLYDDFPAYKIEAAFFLAAAYGFKGRLYADEERKSWVKAAAVISLSGIHGYYGRQVRAFAEDRNARPAGFFRIINELPFVLVIVIVIMVIVKPF